MENHVILGGKVQLYRREDSCYWWCATRLGGKQRRKSTKTDSLRLATDVASDWYLTLQGRLREGSLDKEKTFDEAADKFMEEYTAITLGRRSLKWTEGHEARLRLHLRPFFGKTSLSRITPGMVQDYRVHRIKAGNSTKAGMHRKAKAWPDKLEKPQSDSARRKRAQKPNGEEVVIKPPSPSTLNDEVVTLNLVLKAAVRHEWLGHLPDVSAPYKLETKVSHRPWFSPDEYKRLYEASRENARNPGQDQFKWHAARPTVEVIRTDDLGQPVTELHRLTSTKGRVPGDMQVHTHVAVPNIVETPSGRVGSLDLAELEGRIHEWGALYQAYLASNLRVHGVEMELDQRTEMARVAAIPDYVLAHFSRRTLNGTDAARTYARAQGLHWDSLDADRQIDLLKSGVQNRREGKADDVGDLEAWRRAAASIRYEHHSILRPDQPIRALEREERLEIAYQVAMPLLAHQFDRRVVLDGADARVAAARGLIAAGVESADEVSLITRAFRERGIRRRNESAALIWGTVQGRQGRDRIAITTTLDVREERELIAIARAGSRDRGSALAPVRIKAAVATFPEIDFTNAHGRAQRKIIDQLGTGGRISIAIGVAGAGKSTLLKPLVRAWQEDGRNVYGIALAWRQSDELVEAGIKEQNTRAVASFLRAVGAGRIDLGRKSVVIIDEIGLLGTRQLNDILAVQKKAGFQLVMLGDPKQMQSVEAGSVIELLRRAFGKNAVPELGSSVRQTNETERETTLMFRNGQTTEAIRRKDEDGTLRIVPGGYREAVECPSSNDLRQFVF